MPREEIEPGETLESYFGRTKKNTLDNRPLNNFILKNFGFGEDKYVNKLSITKTNNTSNDPINPFQEDNEIQRKIKNLNKLSIRDANFQEEIHKLLEYTSKDLKEERRAFKTKAHFPLRFTPNLKSKSKWQVRWHPKAAPLVKYAYQIFHGSITPTHPAFHLKLQEILQLSERCIVCRLTNEEWKHPKGVIITGNQEGRCSAKIADPLVPQSAPNKVNLAETYTSITNSIKFLRTVPDARMPTRATLGSTAYDLYPIRDETIPPLLRKSISKGLSSEFPSDLYGHLSSRSGQSLKHSVNIINGVLDSDYRGTIHILLHNHSNKPYPITPKQAIAQILFIPISQLLLEETNKLSDTT